MYRVLRNRKKIHEGQKYYSVRIVDMDTDKTVSYIEGQIGHQKSIDIRATEICHYANTVPNFKLKPHYVVKADLQKLIFESDDDYDENVENYEDEISRAYREFPDAFNNDDMICREETRVMCEY